MKKFISKKLAATIALGMAVSFGSLAATWETAYAEGAEVAVNVSVQQGTIDWTKGRNSSITARGVGLPGNGSEGMARMAAIMDAQRNLLGVVKGVQIDADTLMEDLIVKSDVVRRKVSGLLQGAEVIREGANPDGSYYVEMTIPLYGSSGSVASAALPEIAKNVVPKAIEKVNTKKSLLDKEDIRQMQNTSYTGVIIDASGLGLTPTFSPVIYDENGRAVYGIQNIDVDYAVNEGMVGYSRTVDDATGVSRIGNHPIVIKAVDVRGGNNSVGKVNPIVSVEDADRILLANEKTGMLQKFAVVFVR